MDGVIPTREQAALIRKTFHLSQDETVPLLFPLTGGMTNTSYRFSLDGKDYFFREPGPDSGQFISRSQEALVYQTIADPSLTDDVLVLEPDTGRKISRFIPNTRICDPRNPQDAAQCMALLRRFHDKALQVDHEYDILWLLETYENMMPETSMFTNHQQISDRCKSIAPILPKLSEGQVLCHCDTSPTNFLFFEDPTGPQVRLIDWEFSGNWDPCGDIASFATASDYNEEELTWLVRCYLQGQEPTLRFRLRLYGYLALMNMVWSNWAEYLAGQNYDTAGYGPAQFSNADYYSKRFWELLSQDWREQP